MQKLASLCSSARPPRERLASRGLRSGCGQLPPTQFSSCGFFWIFYGNVLLVALMVGWDRWRGRLMPHLVAGAAGLLGAEYFATWLYFWGPWRALTLHWVEGWGKLTA